MTRGARSLSGYNSLLIICFVPESQSFLGIYNYQHQAHGGTNYYQLTTCAGSTVFCSVYLVTGGVKKHSSWARNVAAH